MPDIDLDFPNRDLILDLIDHIPASLKDSSGAFRKHNTGVYCHDIPVNHLTGMSSIDYKEADQRGYFKIDFLNVALYKDIKNEEHLIKLVNQEPLWELLEQDDFVNLLFQLNGHGNILRQLKPKTVEELAIVIALIRPAKKYLIGKDWETIKAEVWQKPATDEYYFKKAHSFSYATAIVVQMNLICEKILKDGVI